MSSKKNSLISLKQNRIILFNFHLKNIFLRGNSLPNTGFKYKKAIYENLRVSKLLSVLLLQVLASVSLASIQKNKIPDNLNSFLTEGSFRGGEVGTGFSILGIKRVFSTNGNSERLILEIGDKTGKIRSGKPGYFHAQIFKNPSEFNLDLSQVLMSKVSRVQFKSLFKKSSLIDYSNLETDLEDQSTNVFLRFKSSVKIRMFTLSPKLGSSKLVIDITKK